MTSSPTAVDDRRLVQADLDVVDVNLALA